MLVVCKRVSDRHYEVWCARCGRSMGLHEAGEVHSAAREIPLRHQVGYICHDCMKGRCAKCGIIGPSVKVRASGLLECELCQLDDGTDDVLRDACTADNWAARTFCALDDAVEVDDASLDWDVVDTWLNAMVDETDRRVSALKKQRRSAGRSAAGLSNVP